MSPKTILYIEDNEFNRKIVRQLLAQTKYRLREAVDAESGMRMAQGEPPDLILMDVQLPKMSGLDATRQLNSYGWVDEKAGVAHIPIDQAMDMIAKRGLPVCPQGCANAAPAASEKTPAKKPAAKKP